MNKFDSYIIRFIGAVNIALVPWLISSIIEIKTDQQHLEDTKAEKINVITSNIYVNAEHERSEIMGELFVEFGRMIRIKEEELDPFRVKVVKKLDRGVKITTARGS